MSTKKTTDIKPDFISAGFEPNEWNNADLSYQKLFMYIIMNISENNTDFYPISAYTFYPYHDLQYG